MLPEIALLKLRRAYGISGLIAAIVGALILFWPGRTASIVAIFVGIAFLLIGSFNIWAAFAIPLESGWARVGQLVLGGLNLVLAVTTFANLVASTAVLFIVIGTFTGMAWLVDGFVGYSHVKYSTSKAWSIFTSTLSVLGGFSLLLAPLWGAAILWTLLGWTLVVIGITHIIRYFAW